MYTELKPITYHVNRTFYVEDRGTEQLRSLEHRSIKFSHTT